MAMRLRVMHEASTLAGIQQIYESKAHRFKNDEHGDCRSLSPHSKNYIIIRPNQGAPGYTCRYHKTDCVVWHSDDLLTVTPYASLSTTTFVDNLTPSCLDFNFQPHKDEYEYFLVNVRADKEHRIYEVPRKGMTFYRARPSSPEYSHDLWLPKESDIINTPFIDAKSSLLRSALTKTNYFAFTKWLDAVLSFDAMPKLGHYERMSEQDKALVREADELFAEHKPLGLLADLTKWTALAYTTAYYNKRERYSITARRDRILSNLRDLIYREFDAIPVRQVKWFSPDQLKSQLHLRRKYPWLI